MQVRDAQISVESYDSQHSSFTRLLYTLIPKSKPASVAQSICGRLGIRRSRVRSPPVRQHSFRQIDHELFSTAILSLPLIQEGQLSVSGERMSTGTG